MLVLIDGGTARQDHWSNMQPQLLGEFGIYSLWRLTVSVWRNVRVTSAAKVSIRLARSTAGALLISVLGWCLPVAGHAEVMAVVRPDPSEVAFGEFVCAES